MFLKKTEMNLTLVKNSYYNKHIETINYFFARIAGKGGRHDNKDNVPIHQSSITIRV